MKEKFIKFLPIIYSVGAISAIIIISYMCSKGEMSYTCETSTIAGASILLNGGIKEDIEAPYILKCLLEGREFTFEEPTEEVVEETTEEYVEDTTEYVEPTTEWISGYEPFSYDEVVALAQMVYGEAGSSPDYQKRWVAIVAMNHYDRHCNGGYSLWSIVTDKSQFYGYSSSNPVRDDIWNICVKVIEDYNNGKVDWVDYYYFHSAGDGINNVFS